MGLFTGSGPTFKETTAGTRKGLQRFEKIADTPITGVTKSGEVALKGLQEKGTRGLASLAGGAAGDLNTALSTLATQGGGVDPATAAILARQSGQQASKSKADFLSDVAGLQTDVEAGNLAKQEDQKFEAAGQAAQLGTMLDQLINQANAAKFQAQATKDAGTKKLIGGLFSAAGTALGGPLGGAAGGALGSFLA